MASMLQDLIEFSKEKEPEKPKEEKESTVYGTTVIQNGNK